MRAAVLLVHGAFGETSVWADVITALRREGIEAIAAANPLSGLSSDATYVASLARAFDGPVVLGGHDYGGAVIGGVDAPNVVGLVYVAGFALAAGETCVGLLAPPVLAALRPGVVRDGAFELSVAADRFGDVIDGEFALQRPVLAGRVGRAGGGAAVGAGAVVVRGGGAGRVRGRRGAAADGRAGGLCGRGAGRHAWGSAHACRDVAAELLLAAQRT